MESNEESFYRRDLPTDLIELSSEEGKIRFQRAMQNNEAEVFFPLISNLQTQSHPTFCGLTTLVTVLNTLQIDPERIWKFPWRWYSEEMLDCCLNLKHVKESGVTLDQLHMIATCEGAVSQVLRHSDEETIRHLIRSSVRGGKQHENEKNGTDGALQIVIASYDRKVLNQTGSGHFSPIGAYDKQTDSVLILDVARFKVSGLTNYITFHDITYFSSS